MDGFVCFTSMEVSWLAQTQDGHYKYFTLIVVFLVLSPKIDPFQTHRGEGRLHSYGIEQV